MPGRARHLLEQTAAIELVVGQLHAEVQQLKPEVTDLTSESDESPPAPKRARTSNSPEVLILETPTRNSAARVRGEPCTTQDDQAKPRAKALTFGGPK